MGALWTEEDLEKFQKWSATLFSIFYRIYVNSPVVRESEVGATGYGSVREI